VLKSILGLCDRDCKEGRYTDRYRVQDGSQEVFCQGMVLKASGVLPRNGLGEGSTVLEGVQIQI